MRAPRPRVDPLGSGTTLSRRGRAWAPDAPCATLRPTCFSCSCSCSRSWPAPLPPAPYFLPTLVPPPFPRVHWVTVSFSLHTIPSLWDSEHERTRIRAENHCDVNQDLENSNLDTRVSILTDIVSLVSLVEPPGEVRRGWNEFEETRRQIGDVYEVGEGGLGLRLIWMMIVEISRKSLW